MVHRNAKHFYLRHLKSVCPVAIKSYISVLEMYFKGGNIFLIKKLNIDLSCLRHAKMMRTV